MKLYMFRTVRLTIIRCLFTVHSAMVYVIQVSVSSWSCSKAVYKPVWHIPLLSVQWINTWWWSDELSETCRISWQNKFVKLVHLVGFITKNFVTMRGHMNVKNMYIFLRTVCVADRVYPIPCCEPTAGPQATTFVAHRQSYHKSVL